jgi:hypothetical protein
MDYYATMADGETEKQIKVDEQQTVYPRNPGVLWDDPLQGLYITSLTGNKNFDVLSNYSQNLTEAADKIKSSQKFETALALQVVEALYRLLAEKLEFSKDLIFAYKAKDMAALKKIASETIPGVIATHDKFAELCREDWLKNCKPFGFEVIQLRNAGVRARYEETARLINSLIAGEISSIAELDHRDAVSTSFGFGWNYRQIASATVIR